jgi:hypothetical protein
MTELEKIVVTAAVAIVGGLFVYVAGQLLSKFFIEPTHELKKAIGEVRFNLAFHGPTIHTPISRNPERSQKAYEALMKSSCDLLARVNAVLRDHLPVPRKGSRAYHDAVSRYSVSHL